MRKKNKIRMQMKRERMTMEEHEVEKEKNRERNKVGPRVYPAPKYPYNGGYVANEKQINREYKRRIRKGATDAENEYERVCNVLKLRQGRQERDGKKHLLDNLKAKCGMRDLRENGRIIGRQFMRRAKRDKDEEVLWWSYWSKGKMFKDILMKKKPETAAAMKEKEDLLKKKEDERKEIEKDLDAKGRWIYENEEYYWSIPDENGCLKSLAAFEAEEEAEEEAKYAKLTPEEKEEKRKKEEEKRIREKERQRKHDEQMEMWYEQEKEEQRKERNRRVKEKRKKQKEELEKPIDMPNLGEKGAYEKARDDNILERHRVMSESGMFTEKELKSIKDIIVMY